MSEIPRFVSGPEIRLSRLFSNGQNAVVVAIDHGQTFGPMPGLTDLTAAAERLGEADGVLLAPDMIRFTGRLFLHRGSPCPIARLNWTTRHCVPWAYGDSDTVAATTPKTAVSLGAEIVLAALILKTGSEKRDAANVEVFVRLAHGAHALGLPIIAEVFATPEVERDQDAFHDYIVRTCRIACELGADAIKTFYTGERFAEVVEGTPIPIFALGAEKLPHQIDALTLAANAIAAGAKGVVFGRNVLQAERPADFLVGLKDVVLGRATPEEAAAHYNLE